VGDDLLDALGIDAGDVQLGHSAMLKGRRIDRVSPAAAFVSFVSPSQGRRHIGDTNRPLCRGDLHRGIQAPPAPSSSTDHCPDGHFHSRGMC
jgi:hypothetical protein